MDMSVDTNVRPVAIRSKLVFSADATTSPPARDDTSIRQLRRRYAAIMKASVPESRESDAAVSEEGSEDESDAEFFADSSSSDVEVSEDDEDLEDTCDRSKRPRKQYVCESCGVAVAKPALLVQHMRSHSDLKPFVCTFIGCTCAYKRQDHLNRHMKTHEGKKIFCTKPGCHRSFSIQSNLRRHLRYHEEKATFPRVKSSGVKSCVCSMAGCGKSFRYPSQVQTHEANVHGKLKYVELYCMYPGCGDKFTCEKELIKHAENSHPYLLCEVCGETIPRKSFKRHLWMHATIVPSEVACPYDGCPKFYTRETNLRQHIRSVHLQLKPFVCSNDGCGQHFAHKASRDRHELARHQLTPQIDFDEQDKLRLSKGRGGRKPVQFNNVADLFGNHRSK